jgi:DNA polymerase elongation subunit (family B)
MFFDLETSSEYKTLADLEIANPHKADLWVQKHYKMIENRGDKKWEVLSPSESYEKMAALYPEFCRIVCSSWCYISEHGGKMVGKIKSFYDTTGSENSEREILEKIVNLLLVIQNKPELHSMKLCGHNIKRFDIPVLSKRLLAHGMKVPHILQTWGKKPWEIVHLDTQELWQMGSWELTSLDLLACTIGVPSPKENMKGEYVGEAFWKERKYNEIAMYCEEDVKCVARVCHKLSNAESELYFTSDSCTKNNLK